MVMLQGKCVCVCVCVFMIYNQFRSLLGHVPRPGYRSASLPRSGCRHRRNVAMRARWAYLQYCSPYKHCELARQAHTVTQNTHTHTDTHKHKHTQLTTHTHTHSYTHTHTDEWFMK